MLGEPLVEERVVGLNEVQNHAVFPKERLEVEFRFTSKGFAEVVVEIGEEAKIWREGLQVPQVEPLRGEVLDQTAGTPIGQHPAHLALQDLRPMQFTPLGDAQKLFIRNATPEEERQPRGQFEVANSVGRRRRHVGGIALDAKKEFRTDEDRAEGRSNSRLKAAGFFGLVVELQWLGQISGHHGPPVGSACESRHNALGTGSFFAGVLRITHEEFSTTGRFAGLPRLVGTGDRHLIDRGREPGMPVHVVAGLVGIALGFHQRGRILNERHADLVESRLHWDTRLQMGIHRFIVPVTLRGAHLKSSRGVAIEQDFEFVGFVQAFDHLVAVAREADLDLIVAVSGECVSD